MGSGASKENQPSRSASAGHGGQSERLPGSSVLPPRPATRHVPQKSTEPSSNGTSSGTKTINRPTMEKGTTPDHTSGDRTNSRVSQTPRTTSQATSRRGTVHRPNTSNMRGKSANLRRNDTKHLVRQIEMGLEDEEDVDNILGLSRMKTKMLLKREKTLSKIEHKKKMSNFQVAAIKVQTGVRKYDGPKTPQDEIYMGKMDIECPSTARVVRIFTSSTFTDTMHERNKLMEDGYPRIKAFCKDLGYDFQVVDMRWGVRDQATDDHMATEMCLRELSLCKKLSTGPNFVSLMSHKYGYTDFPRCIDATQYETVMKNIESKDVLKVFQKWYSKDMNADPAVYVIHPISVNLPDFLSHAKDKKEEAKKIWWQESELMQSTFEETAQQVFDAQTARKYSRSVTETEVYDGLLTATDPATQCLWLRRTIDGLDKQDSSYVLSRYTECEFNNSEKIVTKKKELLKQVKEDMVKKMPDNILDYTVKWDNQKGINPDNKDHQKYLKQINEDFVSKMCSMIQSAVNVRSKTDDPLTEEIVQHISFCQDKCLNFHGRDDVLQKMKAYIEGMSNEPLVLYGPSGSGKTSIMSMAASLCKKWCNKQAVTVLRFIGTTPDSSNLVALLTSLTSQIRQTYNMSWPVSKDLRALTDEFALSLFLATTDRPLVLILDSLDMLDPSHNARQLHWLPGRLRPNVKIIVSTLPDSQFEAFPVLQRIITKEENDSTVRVESNFVKVPTLTSTDFSEIIDKWLNHRHRRLTPDQKKLVLTMCNKCPLPLYLKLAFDKACAWTSFAPKSVIMLEPTVRQSIDGLFARLEKVHGQIFVSRALGYLTISKSGLTETELEDVLSCDDEVLNDVYMYWTPPIRRLPPLLLVRLRADLDQYLVDRGADNVRVMYWYHRQFVEAAENRYCDEASTNEKLHAALADFFAGTWAECKKKAYTSSRGEKGSADRHVASQPNKFGHSYNLRKLTNLPYHRCLAKQLEPLKKESLSNFEFLLDKLKATNLWQIMDDFSLARKYFPNDDLINNIDDVIHLAQEGLLYDPNQLVPQIIGRLPASKNTEGFLAACRSYPQPSLLPDKRILTQPGGQLIHSMAGHKGDIISLDITANNTTAMSCSDDGTLRLWNIETGQQIQMYDGLGKMSRARFCYNDTCILIDMAQKLTIRAAKTGEKIFDLNSVTDDNPSCLCGNNKSTLVVFREHGVSVYDLTNNTNTFNIECSEEIEFKFPGMAAGTCNFAAVTTSDQMYLAVLDLKKQQLSPLFRGFEPFTDTEIGEEIQYEIDEMTFTSDEKHVVYSNIYSNDIIFLDFKAKKKVKCIKGDTNDYIRSLKSSPDNKALFYVNAAFVTFYDMKSSKKSEELEHTVDVICACSNDMKTIVTSAEDSNIRVWDRTKKSQNINRTPAITAHRIRMVRLLKNPRYIVGFGFKTRENNSQFMFVYDLTKHCSVKERSLDSSILQIEVLSDNEVIIVHDVIQKLKIVDINTLKVTREFQGHLSSRRWNFHVIEGKNEVACLSFGRHNAKVYNIKTGKVACYMESKQQEKMDGLCVNDGGTKLVSWNDESGKLYIFDRTQQKMVHVIKPEHTPMFDNDYIRLTPDGKYVVFKVEVPKKHATGAPAKSKSEEEEIYMQVWDTQKGSKLTDLVDIEYHNRYNSNKEKSGSSAAVDTFELLDNQTVLSAHDDFIIRVFNLNTGSLEHRLEGHRTCVELVYSPKCPYLLTYGSWTEEMALRVWDRSTYTPVASYTLDKAVTNLGYSSDNKFIVATTGKPAEIVKWGFHHFPEGVSAWKYSDYPETITGKDLEGYLDLVPEDENITIDPSDPDKDIEEDSDDDDDDDFM